MSGLTPARLLAPIALVLSALALLIVLTSGGEDPSPAGGAAEPTATATSEPEREPEEEPTPAEEEEPAGTYTVQSGDSPSSIAEEEGVSVDALLEANPDVDPDALAVGDELEIPDQ